MVKAKFSCQQDLKAFEVFHKKLTQLSSKTLEYGYFGTDHYSKLNSATLAWILENGLGSGFPRDFMKSSAIQAAAGNKKLTRQLIIALVNGQNPEQALRVVGKYMIDNVKWVVFRGMFSNPTVSPSWAAVKGFDEALYHHGDLMNSTSYKIIGS